MNDAVVSRPSRSLFGALCRQLTWLRRFIVNALFLLVLILLFLGLVASCQPGEEPDSTTLVLNPTGVLVEHQPDPPPWAALLPQALPGNSTGMTDLLDALQLAADDAGIQSVVLDLSSLAAISQGQAERLGAAIAEFRATGKTASVYSYAFDQNSYLLASHSDAVYLHPMGQALFPGIGLYGLFVRDLLDRLKIDVEIFRVGEQKSATETFTRQSMSPTVKAEYQALSEALWSRWLTIAAGNRALSSQQVAAYAEAFPARLAAAGGDMARAALEAELVDELMSPDEFFGRLNETEGRGTGEEFEGYDFRRYLAKQRSPAPEGRYLGVLMLEGNILMDAPQGGAIGARQTVALLRQLRRDPKLAGLLVRINSPGGSSFASELIRKELELLQLSDRPVYASFADTAASGGYWIAATADYVFAEPTTITGSIGVFSIVPTFPRALAELGVGTDGVGTTNLSGGLSPVRGLNDASKAVFEQSVQQTYELFTTLIARGRELPLGEVEAVADGRVLLGEAAAELGLVNELGSLATAEQRLLEELKLEAGSVRRLIPKQDDQFQLFRELVVSSVLGTDSRPLSLTRSVLRPLQGLVTLDDPKDAYALCTLCTIPRPAGL